MRSAVILTLLTALSLFGCGGDNSQTDLTPPVADEDPNTMMGQDDGWRPA